MKATSWQTTVAGILGGVGALMIAVAQASAEPTVIYGGITVGSLGAGFMSIAIAWGFRAARDDNVSSDGRKLKKGGKLPS